MNRTVWKPQEEIAHSFRKGDRVTIFSCVFCANLSGTGGELGIGRMKRLLNDLAVKVVKSECVLVCCEENVMRQSLRRHRKAIARSDALVVLSCAAGVKAAFLGNPGVPIICPLNTVGSAVVSQSRDPVAQGTCSACGSCVITHTAGICPVSQCPAGCKYGPCNRAKDNHGKCYLSPHEDCIWEIIQERADIQYLEQLKRIHRELSKADRSDQPVWPTTDVDNDNPALAVLRSRLAWVGAHMPSIERWIALFR